MLELQPSADRVLVNRGWVAGDPARLSCPMCRGSRRGKSRGHVYVAPGSPYLLAEQQLEPGWPKRLQAVEMDKFSALCHRSGHDAVPLSRAY